MYVGHLHIEYSVLIVSGMRPIFELKSGVEDRLLLAHRPEGFFFSIYTERLGLKL